MAETMADAPVDAPIDVQCNGVPAVAACVEYYALVSRCFDRDVLSFACQDSLLPSADADVDAIALICNTQLNNFPCR
jgi:hypothetical protein